LKYQFLQHYSENQGTLHEGETTFPHTFVHPEIPEHIFSENSFQVITEPILGATTLEEPESRGQTWI